MPVPAPQLDALERVLDGARLWGAELDTRYRVLATTFEPQAARHPRGATGDRRLQVLFHPVHTVLGVLRRRQDDGRTVIESFDIALLVDVVHAFDGAVVSAPLFDRGEPAPGEWKPEGADWSVEGRATTLDGKAHDLRVSLADEPRTFDLYATFDDVRLRTAGGEELEFGELS